MEELSLRLVLWVELEDREVGGGIVGTSSRKSTCQGAEEWKLMECPGSGESSTVAGTWDRVESRMGSEI